MLATSVVKRILLAKYLYNLAVENSLSHREVSALASANLVHDAVEIFLLSSIEHLNAKIDRRTEFAQLLDKIDEKISPKVLPFRVRLLQLNKIRVSSKHDGIKPDSIELSNIIIVAREFFDEASRSIFDIEFSAINLVSQLDEGEPRSFLEQAEESLLKKQFVDALANARKSIFLVFEKNYDIFSFGTGDPEPFLFSFCEAPKFAQSKSYIEDYVRNPFEYIVIDPSNLDSELLKDGINPLDFWNVWRLTPAVYRDKDGEWLVKQEFNKFEDADIEHNAAYVIETTTDIILRYQARRKSTRWAPQTNYIASLKSRGAKIYKKADLESTVVGMIPLELDQVHVQSLTPSLKRDQGSFWYVSHFDTNPVLIGYVHEADIDTLSRA